MPRFVLTTNRVKSREFIKVTVNDRMYFYKKKCYICFVFATNEFIDGIGWSSSMNLSRTWSAHL